LEILTYTLQPGITPQFDERLAATLPDAFSRLL